ncbi:MAG TPA: copper amine oxidase N-terminal domain-containing protein [Symbiobacteriaceae bacterium]|nr:copper amine oxidase N-terminal domain-containing protein [Symbiobacteriaceae bacterium]
MRKLLALLLAIITVFAMTASASAASEIKVQLDGSEVTFDSAPFVENGRTLVPVRALSEALGFTVGWDEADQRISLTKGETSISLWVDSTRVVVNGKESKLEVPVRKVGSRTFIPLRFVAETLGAHVGWDPDKQTASVTSGKSLGKLITKELSKPTDQKAEGTFEMTMTLKGQGIPGSGMTIPMTMAISSHVYKNEMLSKVSMQAPIGPSTVTEVAARNGKVYTRTDGGAWMETGTFDPNQEGSLYKVSGIQGLDASLLQGEILDSAAVKVAGMTEINGVKVLQVNVDLSKVGIDGMVNQLLGSLPTGDATAPDMKMSLERYTISYFVGPESGFVYRTDIDMAVTMDIKDASGSGTMVIAMKGTLNAKPVSEAIQFSADLPK